LLHLFDVKHLKISIPQWPIHYSPAGNGDMLDTVLPKSDTRHCF
jgi:hypothetical protein